MERWRGKEDSKEADTARAELKFTWEAVRRAKDSPAPAQREMPSAPQSFLKSQVGHYLLFPTSGQS
jgi:hypothetical protein